MTKHLARLFFILAPAFSVGVLAYLFHPGAGVVMFCLMVLVGYEATQARPERGESHS